MNTHANLPPARRRPEDRPDEILTAAMEVFTEKGFAAARVEDIAKRAGLSKGAVYLYFESKDAMLKALVEQSAGAIVNAATAFTEISAGDDPEKAYRAILKMALVSLTDREVSAATRLVMTEAGRSPEIAAYYRQRVIETGRSAVTALIDAGVKAGVFRDVDRDSAVLTFIGPAIKQMMLNSIFQRETDPDFDAEKMADAIADIILNGLKPR
ncbi:TetR/AcrR family transcriptional regulator [Hyphobacterium sp.]|uniref:TetR/AcrR family transcriptional regulator n=1 Tax=Hyphobacterium sp. TaxID=2004662 RepID=UPI003BAAF9FF